MNQALGRLLLACDGLFQKLSAAVLAVESAQHRLRLGELDHALAGEGRIVLEALIGTLAQVSGKHEDTKQDRQRHQRDQPHLHIQCKQRDEDHHRRDHTGDQRGEHVGGQLGHFHHALGRHMTQPRGVLRAEPAYRQARHMVAEPMTATLQDGDADPDTGLLHRAPQRPAQRHADHQHHQPLRRRTQLATQQVGEYRHQGDYRQPAKQAIDQRHPQVAAQYRGLFAQQLNKGVQHDDTACSEPCS